MVADVLWFGVEFRVVDVDGASEAYGAGLLSSPGELQWFGPDTVPESNRSPARTSAPLVVMWASCCAGVQYMSANEVRLITSPWSSTSRWRSKPVAPVVRR